MIKRKGKRPKKSYRKQLESQVERLQRLMVIKRDGGCVLRGVLQHQCSDILQADHLLSRKYKSIFFDLRNLNCVCSSMNMQKQWDCRIFLALSKITENRSGEGTVDLLDKLSRVPSKMTILDLETLVLTYRVELKIKKMR